MTIEEIFNLRQGTDELHNLLDIHTVHRDDQDRVTTFLLYGQRMATKTMEIYK